MTREELIKQCRYYKGQKENPFTDDEISWFWDMERVYVESGGTFNGENEVYKKLNGRRYTGIPYYLLMVMFTGWAKYVTNIEKELSKFYNLMELYLDFVSDHISKTAIPG